MFWTSSLTSLTNPRSGHLDILDLLVREEGLPVGDADTQGFTAVHFAAKSGHRATVRHLAAMKADLKVRSKDPRECKAARHASPSHDHPFRVILTVSLKATIVPV